jgi:sialic acid synthase SpsE
MSIKIIAEAAQGHEGSIEKAKLLIRSAAKSNADIIKFQLVYADELCTKSYQYYDLFTSLEFKLGQVKTLKQYADDHKIELMFDIFGLKSLRVVLSAGLNSIKVHGTDIQNFALLNAISKSKIQKVFMGTGGATLSELNQAIKLVNNKKLVLLHGFQGYPTRVNENQISRIAYYKEKFSNNSNISLGFSDHSPNNDLLLSIANNSLAISLGAKFIEKHISLNSVIELEDFESALSPENFSSFVRVIKKMPSSLGTIRKNNYFGMSKNEIKYREAIRKQIFLKTNCKKGQLLSENDIYLKRDKQSYLTDIELVLGKELKQSLKKDTPLQLKHLQSKK